MVYDKMSIEHLRASPNYVWDINKVLGQGATSRVYIGREKKTGEEVAVKVFTSAGLQRALDVQYREFSVMSKIKHQNVVRLLAIEEEEIHNHKIIVMELSQNGSLYTLLDDPKNSLGLEEEEFLIVLKDITAGIQHLREKDIVHRDIKPGNILVFKDENGRSVYKLTDFGAAKQLESEDEQFMSLYGTEEYLHPNIYGRAVIRDSNIGPFDATVDLWSLGVTIYHAATGQLPFKAYGGRRNRQMMYDITKNKASGMISGVQKYENGPIEWSRDLPVTCLLSSGLKKHLVPLLARLLESNEQKRWSFDRFFGEVDLLMSKVVINVYCSVTWSNMKIYLDRDAKLSRLQELIAEQSEVAAVNQILVFERELLESRVDPLTPVISYPKSISELNPIFVYLKSYPDHKFFPTLVYPEFPKFGNSVHPYNDYQLAKMCCTIMYHHLHLVQWYHKMLKLLRQSVHSYIHELHHEITHLVDYLKHQKQHYETSRLWTKNYNQTVTQNVLQLRGVLTGNELESKEKALETSQSYVKGLDKQVVEILRGAENKLTQIKKDELQKRRLEHFWKDDNPCHAVTHRCGEKIEMMLESMKKIVSLFKENRHNQYPLQGLAESIHLVEKNRLQTLCSKSLSILENCTKCSEKHYHAFFMWYSQAVDTRNSCDKVNVKLGHLETRQNEFVRKLDEISKNMIGTMIESIQEPQFKPKKKEPAKQKSSDIFKKINHKLECVGHEVIELKQNVDENSQILRSTEKQIIENEF